MLAEFARLVTSCELVQHLPQHTLQLLNGSSCHGHRPEQKVLQQVPTRVAGAMHPRVCSEDRIGRAQAVTLRHNRRTSRSACQASEALMSGESEHGRGRARGDGSHTTNVSAHREQSAHCFSQRLPSTLDEHFCASRPLLHHTFI